MHKAGPKSGGKKEKMEQSLCPSCKRGDPPPHPALGRKVKHRDHQYDYMDAAGYVKLCRCKECAPVLWLGSKPTKCQTCSNKINKVFYDMATTMGPWGILCPTCALLGPGIGRTGTGFGQKYELQNGQWVKTEG